jgi:uncharacterized protein (TIGR02231 family)
MCLEKDLKLEAPITEVTVFQGKALVTREGKVDVEPGESVVTLKNLPLSISPDSLRVSGEGLEGSMITGAEIKVVYEIETIDIDRRGLEERYKAALEKQEVLQEEVNELNRQQSQLEIAAENFLESFPKALAYHKSNLEDHKRFMDYVISQRADLGTRVRERRKALEDVTKEVNAIRGNLDLSASKAGRDRNRVDIGIVAKKAGPIKLTITYAVNGASWEPVYDARVITDDETVNISYFGIVRQDTGEDWEDVSLVLSTAPHTESRDLPKLDPWYLSTYRPEPRREMFKRSRGMAKAEACQAPGMGGAPAAPMEEAYDKMAETEEEPVDLEIQTAEVKESGEAIVFKVQRKDTVPSDGQPKKLAVSIIDLKCKTEYLAVPKLTPEAYLKAKVKNTSEFMLLAGKVNLFQEDDFIGATNLSSVAPGEKFELSLGVARRIKVERELVKRDTEGTGLLKGSRKLTYGYNIKVENHKKVKSKFVIMDQLPLPQHEDIKVEPTVLSPEPKSIDDLKIVMWKFYLEPETKKTIKFEFAVEHPTKISVYGLPE